MNDTENTREPVPFEDPIPPLETENGPRPEDGPQDDVSQDPEDTTHEGDRRA
jgi:hypothetical protein